MKICLAICALAMPLLAGAAAAGDLASAGAEAERLAAAGRFDEAMSALDAARDTVWRQAPLSFASAIFVTAEPQGFGIFDRRQTSIFKRSEPLYIYAEPAGYGFGRDGDLYTIDLALDFTVTNPAGAVVAHDERFGALTLRSRAPNREFMAKVTYNFSGLEPGDYAVTTTAHDMNSGKTGDFTLKFSLVD